MVCDKIAELLHIKTIWPSSYLYPEMLFPFNKRSKKNRIVPTAKELFLSRIFPGLFPGQSMQDLNLKIAIGAKRHIIFIQYMLDYLHFYGTASSLSLLAV